MTAPQSRQALSKDSIRREFSLDYDHIEGDTQTDGANLDEELVSNDVDDLVKEPVYIPSTARLVDNDGN